MRYYDFPIVEYTNPCFPDTPYYKCTIDGTTRHNTNLEVIKAWRKDVVNNTNYRAQAKIITNMAMESFVKDLKNKD
jgi:hypothetical protein